MSWLFSRALVAEFLADTCLDGEPSAQLSGTPTQLAYCAPDKTTRLSRLSRYGMTFKPLTENLGEELLIAYRAGFHAKTFQSPGGGRNLRGAIWNVETHGSHHWRGSTQIRVCGKQPNAHF